jgi:multidrug resistance efflux pump
MLSREEAALDVEKAALAALERGTRPEERAVSQAELDRAKATTEETREALLNALAKAYATADTAIHKTADQLFDQPTILPRLLFYSKDSGSQPTLEATRQDIEILLNAWYSDIRTVVGTIPPSGLFSFIARSQLATVNSLENMSVGNATETARNNLLTISYFLDELIEYSRDIIPGANITQSAVETYVAALTLERTTVLSELTTLNTAYKAFSDAERAESLAFAQFNLSEAGSSNEDIRAARARVAAQEARVRELRSEREKFLIRSPFSAVVVSRDAEVGELASAGVPIIALDGDGDLEVDARISELDVVALRVGDKADVIFDAIEGTSTITASIVSIDPAETTVDGVSGYGVSLVFDSVVPSARPGMSVDVLIKRIERERALAVQLGYIRRSENGAFVQVLESGRVSERPVVTGITIPGRLVELISGVRAGETLVPYDAR